MTIPKPRLRPVKALEWMVATLPQPMGEDCKIAPGKFDGPKNHALCATHLHILDTDNRMVIAHDRDEYRAMFAKK